MGYATGQNNNGREIGYGVEATCDHPGCNVVIDRGIAYCCGGDEGPGNAGMDDEPYCGGYFCASHLFFIPSLGKFDAGLMVCLACLDRAECPTCRGRGHDGEGEYCETCDSHGVVTQCYVNGVNARIPV